MKRIGQIAGVIVTICILVILISFSSFTVRPFSADKCVAGTKAFHQIPENSVDVIVYGSSHAWRGVDVGEMYESYGIGAYNYGCNWQQVNTEALFFYDSLRTQSPKLVLFDTFRINELVKDTDLTGEIYYTRYLENSSEKKEYLKSAFGKNLERWVAYAFPFSQFHSGWDSSISEQTSTNWYAPEDYVNTMGYYNDKSKDRITPVEIGDPNSQAQYELDAEAIAVLDGVVKTCQEKDIKLVFLTIPWEGANNYNNAIVNYAVANGCDYIDMFQHLDDAGIDLSKDFGDEGHMNKVGAKKIGNFLGAYLTENYDLPDRRKEPDNLWEGKTGNQVGYEYSKWLDAHGMINDQ